jgi:hypothetical protein
MGGKREAAQEEEPPTDRPSSSPAYCKIGEVELDEETCEFYRSVLRTMSDSEIQYLVGGAYALYQYTGVSRHTKDLDLFVREEDVQPTLDALSKAGYPGKVVCTGWLAKAYYRDLFADIIFASMNGVSHVDDEWFENGVEAEVLGMRVKLCPPEEMLWQKVFVMSRERYDGADVAHLLLARGKELDWQRLARRLEPHPRVLLSHLILFGFIYPSHRDLVPDWLMSDLIRRVQDEAGSPAPTEQICYGTLFSRDQYLFDTEQKGYKDARLRPIGTLTPEELVEEE